MVVKEANNNLYVKINKKCNINYKKIYSILSSREYIGDISLEEIKTVFDELSENMWYMLDITVDFVSDDDWSDYIYSLNILNVSEILSDFNVLEVVENEVDH